MSTTYSILPAELDSIHWPREETWCSALQAEGTPLVSYGLPYTEAAVKRAAFFGASQRILIIASKSLSRLTDRVDRLQEALGDRVVFTRYGLSQHTLWSEVLEVVAKVRELNVELIITIGAGSITDGAKLVSLAVANNAQSVEDLDQLHSCKPNVKSPSLPVLFIPTTLSGGEWNSRAGGTKDSDRHKYSFTPKSPMLSAVILDPELTTTTPDEWWLSTGIRAVDHCVETLCSLQSNGKADETASRGLPLLIRGLLRSKANPKDLNARLECQFGVVESIKAMILFGVEMGASHGIGHQLGPLGVGHGVTSCILLPAVCRYNARANSARQDAVVRILWDVSEAADVFRRTKLSQSENPADLATLLRLFFGALGVPGSLEDLDLDLNRGALLDRLAAGSLLDRCAPTNPIPLTEKRQVVEILELAGLDCATKSNVL